ncbi:MAG: response regulator [Desulfovibrio sp.]|nr:response regulator [Desulfovibrio sp.]
MSIRALIKTSNIAQLCMVIMLGLCTFWFGHSLYEVNGLLHNYHRFETLLAEIGSNSRESYRAAFEFISGGDAKHLERWRHLLRVERGEAARPGSAPLAPDAPQPLTVRADRLEINASTRTHLRSILTQVDMLNSMTEAAMLLALGTQKGGSTAQGHTPGDRNAALRWMHENNLARLPDSIAEAARKLGDAQYAELLVRLGEREAPLRWTMLAAIGALVLLGASVLGNAHIFKARVVNPLDQVSGYAESVAAGFDPEPLHLRHRDELALMFASLQRMKGTLFSRIQELKEAERRARKSRQQAVLARSQALTSLELAQRASHVQDDFLRRISHEIRTPLNAIIGMSYLSLQTDLSGAQRDYLAQINKSGSVLLDMVNRILDFSSASEGSMRMERKVFALSYFMELLRQSVAGTALEKRLLLNFTLDPAIPATVVGDERHLEEVLRILLDNAVKYTVSGSVEFRVLPSDEPPTKKGALRLTFVVSDTGPGLDREEWKKLFEPFALGDESMTRARGGLGLGLALARQLVNLMGGELAVQSAPGEGSRFSFSVEMDKTDRSISSVASSEKTVLTLPARTAPPSDFLSPKPDSSEETPVGAWPEEQSDLWPAAADAATDAAADAATTDTTAAASAKMPAHMLVHMPRELGQKPGVEDSVAASALAAGASATSGGEGPAPHQAAKADTSAPRTVLVVEDNDINAQIARELLEQAGLEVILAANGQEALDRLKNFAPAHVALVLMDVQMPVMDGLEATRRIRSLGFSPADLPVVAMTAHTDMASRMDGKDVGMDDYLTKPVNPEMLYATLEKWLPGGLGRNPAKEVLSGDKRRVDVQAGSLLAGAVVSSGGNASAGCEDGSVCRLQTIEARMKGQHSPAINIEAGLATVGNNRKLYLELLLRFVAHYGDSPAQLRAMLDGGKLRAAARMAHTVKGVAANLGVDRIHRLTRMMEEALPDNPPDPGLLKAFDVEMGQVLEYVQGIDAHAHAREARCGNLQLAEEHRTALLALLGELPKRVETDWGGVEGALEALMALVEGTPHAEDVGGILAAVKDFDTDGMTARADRLREKLLYEVV